VLLRAAVEVYKGGLCTLYLLYYSSNRVVDQQVALTPPGRNAHLVTGERRSDLASSACSLELSKCHTVKLDCMRIRLDLR